MVGRLSLTIYLLLGHKISFLLLHPITPYHSRAPPPPIIINYINFNRVINKNNYLLFLLTTAALQTQSALHRLASTNSLVVGEALKGIRFFGAKWKSLRSAKNYQPRKATEKVLAHNDRRDCLHDQPWALVAPTCVEFISIVVSTL